ncbi:MAG: site-specific integrase [Candidatus Marinimicrobia bacterium]|nr:site-specific integrase [Candidatus Neomarinimicrobiota bacterium]
MNVSQASKIWLDYHQVHSKHNTIRAYKFTITRFNQKFADIDLNEVSTDDILDFMTKFTEGLKPQTKRIRFSHLTAFFNFMRINFDCDFKNPCDSPMLRKLFRPKAIVHWDIIEKETVDEIIFRTDNVRNRLMLELMARGGMRVGEVLKLTPADILGRKLILNDTKSGKEQELIFIPQKVADRLKEYVRVQKIAPKQMIFPICYGAARAMVKKAGQLVGIRLRPHDLRRHAATFASRSNVPLEIISKVILRHSSLQTTEIYLGKVSDTEAIRWIENLYA